MTPAELKQKILNALEYPFMICLLINDGLTYLWNWFNGKKIIIGAFFYLAKDTFIYPIVKHYNDGLVPEELAFWLGLISMALVTVGSVHKLIKRKEEKELIDKNLAEWND